jgi:hypothetical protein
MSSKTIIAIIGISLISIFYTFRLIHSNEEPIRPSITEVRVVDSLVIDSFSEANLIILMENLEIREPQIVLNQAKLETGNFKSYLFKVSNNLFGFRNYNGYKKYKNWQCSVVAYKEWQDKHYKGGDYYWFLKYVHYAVDSNYCNKLKQFK